MKLPVRKQHILGAALLSAALALSACQSAPQPTPASGGGILITPTVIVNDSQPAPEADAAYPAAPTAAPLDAQSAYPAGQAPTSAPADPNAAYPADGMGAQTRENLSVVTARLISQTPDPENADQVRLHVLVLASEPAEGKDSFTQNLLNQEIDLTADAAGLPALQPEDTFSANVTYRGDANGAVYYATQIQAGQP